jgi:hypothetical protein
MRHLDNAMRVKQLVFALFCSSRPIVQQFKTYCCCCNAKEWITFIFFFCSRNVWLYSGLNPVWTDNVTSIKESRILDGNTDVDKLNCAPNCNAAIF